MKPKIPRPELETNINVLHALMKPGQSLSQREIAAGIGCTQGYVNYVEQEALRKIKKRLGWSVSSIHDVL